jgi:recombination protein RecA
VAKKKTEEAVSCDSVNAQIIKEHGEVILSAEQFFVKPKPVVSFSPSWDYGTGGIPQGSWVVMNGPPKSGKSNNVFQLMANAQQQLGMKGVIAPVEGRLKLRDMKNIHNLDWSADKLEILYSTEDNILSAEKQLEILDSKMRAEKNLIVFIDSFSALIEEERHTEFGKKTRGQLGQILYNFCSRNAHVVPLRDHIIIGITHTIANTGNGPSTKVERMPTAMGYQNDIKIKSVWPYKQAWLDAQGNQIGIKSKWEIENHATNVTAGRIIESRFLFGHGISHEAELMDFGIDLGIIEKAGSWFKFRKDGEVVLQGQGWADFFDKLSDPVNKHVYDDLVKEIQSLQ